MQHGTELVRLVSTRRGQRRYLPAMGWLLLLLASALTLGPQLGCRSPQTSDGAGGQSGDEGRSGEAPPAPRFEAN